jgi:peroxiredoxin
MDGGGVTLWLICARLVGAAVLIAAAVGKLLDREGGRNALLDFGVPAVAVEPGLIVLPAAEVAIGFAVLVRPAARWGAVAGALLLGGFLIVMVNALRRGKQLECHCFGALHSAPVGRLSVARNAVLAAVLAAIASRPSQPSIAAWFGSASASKLAIFGLATALASVSLLAIWLWVQNGRLRSPPVAAAPTPPLEVASRAPAFRAQTADGHSLTLRSALKDRSEIALIFMAPGCDPCRSMLPDIARWQVSLAGDLPLFVVSAGTREQAREAAREHGVSNVLLDPQRTIAESYGVSATPCAVVVNGDGTIASGQAVGASAIEALIRRTLRLRHAVVPASEAA